MSDKALYQIIADELKNKTMDAALWTQAYATAEGNADKTEAGYIRLRFLDLKKNAPQGSPQTVVARAEPSIRQVDGELIQLRSKLARKLYSQGKHSLYTTLGLNADASEAVVAAAIADLEVNGVSATGISPAEFKYAKDTLGNAAAREQYDRQLMDSLSDRHMTAQHYTAVMDGGHSWWESGRIAFVIGVLSVALFGYLGLNYFKARNDHEVLKQTVETEREVAVSASDSNQARVQADIDFRNRALRAEEELLRQEQQYRASTTDRVLEQQRLEQERRAQADQQRLALQQEQAEKLRVSREKQYYACLNQYLLSQRNVTNADAYARCAMYR